RDRRSAQGRARSDRQARRESAARMYSRIIGTGQYLPERVLTNFDLEKMVETSDEWIRTRTGIERRHIAADGEATSDLAAHAARAAIADAGLTPSDIDFL